MRFVTILLPLVACQSVPRAEVPRAQEPAIGFRGGLDHSGQFDSTAGTSYGGIAWRVVTEGPVRSSPAVTDSLVLVGSGDGNLYAIERRSGQVRWKFLADGAVNSSPAVRSGTVYFASLTGTMYAVGLADGQRRWSTTTGSPLPPSWAGASGIDYYVSSPVVTDDLVIVGAADGILYALARTDGTVRWRGRIAGRIHSSPAVRNGAIFVGSFDGSVYAFDLSTGAQRWRFDTEGRSLDSEPFGFDRRSIISSPAVTDSAVYIGSRDGHFYAIDVRTGTLRWRVDHDMLWSIASPAVDRDIVYDASSDARFVHALSAGTGAVLWRLATAGSVWSSPAVASTNLFIGDGSGAIYAIDRRTGQARWSFRTGAAVMSSPAVADGVLYVGSADGAVYALRISEGPGLERAVYWDSAQAAASMRTDHRQMKDGLVSSSFGSLGPI